MRTLTEEFFYGQTKKTNLTGLSDCHDSRADLLVENLLIIPLYHQGMITMDSLNFAQKQSVTVIMIE
jgi:hypothetical protein